MIRKTIGVLMIIIVAQVICHSQNSTLSQLFAQEKYSECINESESVLKSDSENSQAYFFKGASLVRLKRYDEAEKYLDSALTLGFPPNPVNAYLMRVYAGLHQEEAFFNLLEKSAAGGLSNFTFLDTSEEFNKYKSHPKFAENYNFIYNNAFPCKSKNGTQRLDFWIGEWDIFLPGSDIKVASSLISKSQDGCTLFEDYEHNSGFLGRSINYFDPADSLFKQTWVDLRNRVSHYVETHSAEGILTMQADLGGGSFTRTTWTYYPKDDTVLQAAENSNDGGQSWSPGFTGLYKRKSINIAHQLESQAKSMEDAFNNNDMEKLSSFYTNDAQIFEPGGGFYNGYDAIDTYWKTLKDNGISWNLDFEEMEMDGHLIYTIMVSDLKYKVNETPQRSKTKALVIWQKTKTGEYKIKKDFFHFVK